MIVVHIEIAEKEEEMNFVAIQMLIGDRAKYLGLIFSVAFSTFLM